MVAGGTGFAPLKSMLRHVLETGIRRDIHFCWGARHVRDLYEEPLVLEWVRRHTQLTFTAVLSEATALEAAHHRVDRKSTRLNSSHSQISYAVFCLKKKKKKSTRMTTQMYSE